MNAVQPMEKTLLQDSIFYLPTHLRLSEWTIGIMLGYIMYQTRGAKVNMNKFLAMALWVLSISSLIAIVVGMFPFQQIENNSMTKLENSLYNTFHRVGWALAVAWMIFACQNGSGGIVRWFLSLKQWQPFSRMGLSIYLVHRIYQVVTDINEMQPIYWDFFSQIQKFFGDVLVSVFLGAILYLAVESPLFIIEDYLHKKITVQKITELELNES